MAPTTQSRVASRIRNAPKGNGAPAKSTAKLMASLSKQNTADSRIVAALQRQAANALVLYMNYKHYHWQTYGPMFRDLHLLFDDFADAVLPTLDEFAERVRMIGQDPVASPAEMLETASVRVAAKDQTMREMMQEADKNLLIVIAEMRQAAKLADEVNDPGTVDIFSRHVQVHEKYEWWLRDILEARDGLSN